MNFASTNCCGIQEITNLSMSTSPEDALTTFCTKVFGSARKVVYKSQPARPQTIYSFYLFTAAVAKDAASAIGYYRPYGKAFADFLKTQKLGKVSTLPAKFNLAFHPEHKVQAWIWSPNKQALEKWWTLRQAQLKADKLAVEAAEHARIAAALAKAQAINAALVKPPIQDNLLDIPRAEDFYLGVTTLVEDPNEADDPYHNYDGDDIYDEEPDCDDGA